MEKMFSKKHYWIINDGDTVRIGFTDFLQEKLGAIMFINLPEKGSLITKGEVFGDVESQKTVMDLEAPVSGEVMEVNNSIIDEPYRINEQPYENWLIKVKADSIPDSLIDEDSYNKFISKPWMQNH